MSVQEVDEIDDLKNDLGNLKVIKDHVVIEHLLKSPVMEVKDKIIRIGFYFFLKGHPHGGFSVFAIKMSILDGDAVESHQVGAVVGFELLNIHEKGL